MPRRRARGSVRWPLGERCAQTALFLGVFCFPSLTRAAVEEVEDVATFPRHVEVHVTGEPEAIEKTRETLKELFGRLHVAATVMSENEEPPPRVEPPLAIAYIDFSPPHATVVIVDGESGEEVDRREFPDEKTLETSVEASAHVVYLVVEAMLTREKSEESKPPRASIPRSSPPPSAPPAPAPATPRDEPPPLPARTQSTVAMDAGVSFAVTRLAPSRVAPGGGINFELASVRYRFGASLYATTYAPSELDYGGASAFARVSSLRALLTQDLSLSEGFSVALAVGGGVEWLRLEPESAPAGVTVKARSLFSPLVTSLAGIRIRLSEHAFVSGWAGVDFDLSNERLVANVDGRQPLVLALSGMRPTMMVTASTPLGADTRFGSVEAQ